MLKVPQVLLVQVLQQALQEPKVLKVRLVHKVLKAQLVHKVQPVPQVQQVHQVLQ